MRSAVLYQQYENKKIKCNLCAHYCTIAENKIGICGTRQNIAGELFPVNYGRISSIAVDPIEKKPFYHYAPGSKVLSFGLEGCNFSCLNCQNSDLSQNIKTQGLSLFSRYYPPEKIVDLALESNVDGIAYTYSEPTVFFEYAYDVINACRKNDSAKSLKQLFISNGYQSKESRGLIIAQNLIDAINIDLKFMDEKKYLKICHAKLKPVLENIKAFVSAGIHVEIINLLIPGENDSEEEITKLCEFLAEIDINVPLHFSRFFPNYLMLNKPPTSIQTMLRAKEIANDIGLNFVYLGNVALENASDTFCRNCHSLLIQRKINNIIKQNIEVRGERLVCSVCGEDNNIRK